ncbi:MAG: hypothetical protein ABIV63_15695 [Caldimonas sp.]
MNDFIRRSAGLVSAGFMLGALCAPQVVNADEDDDASQVKRGFELVPKGVHLSLAGKNRALVGLGSYLVNTSGCIDCHSHPSYAPGGDPFQGQPEMVNAQQYLSGGRTFGPFIKAPNLTPDFAGKPAGLTLKQFLVTLRTGHNPNDPPGQVLQVMPWPAFGKKTERDLNAIYEYLRAIPSLPDNPNPGP